MRKTKPLGFYCLSTGYDFTCRVIQSHLADKRIGFG